MASRPSEKHLTRQKDNPNIGVNVVVEFVHIAIFGKVGRLYIHSADLFWSLVYVTG